MNAVSKMEAPPDFDLSTFMRVHGVLRIARVGGNFTVAMEGDRLGTGQTVQEALESARGWA